MTLKITTMRLDIYDELPSGMKEYLSSYGWHFSKRMFEYAVSNMYSDKSGLKPYTKEEVDNLLAKYNIVIKNKSGYDYVYIANMCKFDFLSSSVPNEMYLAKYVRDVIDDVDGYPELPFTRYYADCIGKGMPIDWEDMI